jgi:hypothetical protein
LSVDKDRGEDIMGRITHGAYVGGKETPEHYIWREMHRRCREDHKHYEDINVDASWNDYQTFLDDVGPRPSELYTLHRIDPFGDYKPGNVKWAKWREQMVNTKVTKRYRRGSFTGALIEVAEHLGISKELAFYRWRKWGTFVRGEKWEQLQKAK